MLAARRPGLQEHFGVWEENLEAVVLFRELETQWDVAVGLGGVCYQRLIYAEASNLMREKGLPRKRRAELLEDLRVMERAALPILNGRDDG